MTKDVMISISGIQTDFVETDSVEMITTGQYYHKNNKHYINYIDNDIAEGKETKTTIKISDNKIDILRFGGANTHLVFEVNKKNMTHYETPFGALLIGLKTKEIDFKEEENELKLEVLYQLEINHNFIGENSFKLRVQNIKNSSIHLLEGQYNQETNGENYL